MSLEQSKCIVTGGGTGIGRGIARVLARSGAHVAVVGRRPEPLAETVSLIEADGGRAVAREMNVAENDSVVAGMKALHEELGGLTALINNAGVGGPNGCAVDGPDRWDDVVRPNLDGPFYCARAAAPLLADGGRIVNVSSVLGKFGVPGYTAYCASKHGVIGLTKALALEFAPRGITVNAICPGWVETVMAKDGMELIAKGAGVTYDKAREEALGMVPMGQMIDPEEIGGLVAYLCSPAAANMTGQAISLCGGATMG